MINIEKEFYERVNKKFGECSSVVYKLVEDGAFGMNQMERYLIKAEYRDFVNKERKNKTLMGFYADLAEKYNKSDDSIWYIIHKT